MEKLLSQACDLFEKHSGLNGAICGGVAIDLFPGRQTRAHKDLDVSLPWEDRPQAIAWMMSRGWRVLEAGGGGVVREITDGSGPSTEKRNLFCFTAEERRAALESIGENRGICGKSPAGF